MKDLSRSMDIAQKQMEEEEEEAAVEAAKKASMAPGAAGPSKTAEASASVPKPATAQDEPLPSSAFREKEAGPTAPYTTSPARASPAAESPNPYSSGSSTPRRGIPMRPALMDRSHDDPDTDPNITPEEAELRRKEKKKAGLSKEQREEMLAYEKERKRIRDERIDTLARKLIDRISIWTETDKGPDVTKAFQAKTQLEVENLKMESFGLEILHAIGTTYLQKATSFLKSQKFLGISGFFSRLKDKGSIARETWTTISTAIDAQMTMEEMAKMEEKGGEDWTDEKKAEYEQRVTGKVLAAAWRGSKFEIQSVLRAVCDKVLYDKNVTMDKRIERAQALVIAGEIFNKVCPLFFLSSVFYFRSSLFFCSSPVPRRLLAKLPSPHRLIATPTRKGSLWRLRSSWRTPRRSKARTRTRTRRKRRRRRRKRRKSTKSMRTRRRRSRVAGDTDTRISSGIMSTIMGRPRLTMLYDERVWTPLGPGSDRLMIV
jgi:hypothetical protein